MQHRIFVRFARFSNRIYLDDNDPLPLRTQLRTKVDESVNPVACSLTKELRYNRKITISETYNTKFGELTFEKFFTQFGKNYIDLLSSVDSKLF